MTNKPTYEELEQRVKELEQEEAERKQAEEALQESKERFRAIFETAQDSIFIKDRDLTYSLVNPSMERLFGVPASQLVGKSDEELFGDDAGAHIREVDSCVLRGEIIDEEDTKPVSSVPTTFHVIKVPIRDNSGEIIGLCGIARDITKQKQAEEALKKAHKKLEQRVQERTAELSKINDQLMQEIKERKQKEEELRRYERIVAASSDHMSLADRNYIYQVVNDAYLRSNNLKREDIVGNSVPALFGQEFFKQNQKPMIDRCLAGQHVRYDAWIDFPALGRRYMDIAHYPYFEDDNSISGYVVNARDITELKQAEKSHDELEHRVKERTKELEIKTKSLKEINTALEVLLKKRAEDKIEIEDNVLTNVNKLIAPYLKKVKSTELDDEQIALVSIIESNINEIISPFTRRMSLKYLSLTPTEIQIANLVKIGHPTKKIAKILNISPRTVDTHRKNIRTKIGLDKKRANLRSHLLALQ